MSLAGFLAITFLTAAGGAVAGSLLALLAMRVPPRHIKRRRPARLPLARLADPTPLPGERPYADREYLRPLDAPTSYIPRLYPRSER